MAAYTLQRILWLIPVLFCISLITFALMHAVEGGPWDGPDWPLPPEVVENLQRKYGLDEPLWRQYVDFATNALRGDLGVSYSNADRPVSDLLLDRFKTSAVLGLLAVCLALPIGIGLGVLSAVYRNRLPDHAGVLFATLGAAVPAFVLAIFLRYLFSVKLGWLPVFGWNLNDGPIPGWLPPLEQMVLPVVTLAALPAALLARVTRASLLDVLEQDYIRTARAKGLPERSVLLGHALRSAAIPVLTVIGPLVASLITGSFIIEHLFSIPGSGRLFIQSIEGRDYGMIMGATLFFALVIALANLVVDLAYAYLDPRIRYR